MRLIDNADINYPPVTASTVLDVLAQGKHWLFTSTQKCSVNHTLLLGGNKCFFTSAAGYYWDTDELEWTKTKHKRGMNEIQKIQKSVYSVYECERSC